MKHIFLILLMGTVRSHAQNIRILEFSKGGNEPALAINPHNNAQVILAFNNFNVFKSDDTCKTFKRINVTSKYGFYGDPVLSWGFEKDAYLAHLAQNKKHEWPESFDRIVFQKIKFDKNKVTRSTGIGLNPNKSLLATSDMVPSRSTGIKMQDKPWFTVNRNLNDPHYGRIHIAWTEFDGYGSRLKGDSSRIRYAWSDNKGQKFSRPVTISRKSGDAKDADSTLEGATLCTDNSGNTYCLWSGLNKLWFTSSSDGGLHWQEPSAIKAHESGWHLELGGIMRANGMPFLVSLNKNLLAVWAAKQNGVSSVLYMYYNLETKTWGEIRNVIIPELENAFMPQVCAYNDKAFIVFYSSVESTLNKNSFELKVYTAMLDENTYGQQVSYLNGSAFISEGKPFLGDYIAICPLNQSGNQAIIAYCTLKENKDTYIAVAKIKF